MKTLKQLIPFGIAIAIMIIVIIGSSWLFEHGYISKINENILSIGIGILLFLAFLPSILKK